MSKILLVLFTIITIATSLTVQVNNIHHGYKNIYVSTQLSLQSSSLTLNNYKLTKQELPKGLLGFITFQDHLIKVDFNKLIRKYQVQELDIQNPLLRFQFEQRKYIVVTIFTQTQDQAEIQILNNLINLGKDESQSDL